MTAPLTEERLAEIEERQAFASQQIPSGVDEKRAKCLRHYASDVGDLLSEVARLLAEREAREAALRDALCEAYWRLRGESEEAEAVICAAVTTAERVEWARRNRAVLSAADTSEGQTR